MICSPSVRRFFRFCIAGLGNTAAHYLIALCAFEFAGFTMPIANLHGCIVAIILSYFVNSRFVFRERASVRKFGRFVLVNTAVLAFAYFSGALVAQLHWPIAVAVVLTGTFGVTVGFAAHSLITFRRGHQKQTT